ncbi:hypothetical protein QFZ79_000197 [Arthrobacter sp. V4I6]|nr:hypothetical protein [Arthrobacter sp. V1I7]MDQ0852086.1 hypothetical protein [Arthrobacter sp. V4I6]
MTQLIAGVRRFGREIPGGQELVAAQATGYDYTRSIAWLTRGNRRVPHRGISRNNAWLNLRTAGLNLRRLLNLGLTDNNGTWALP